MYSPALLDYTNSSNANNSVRVRVRRLIHGRLILVSAALASKLVDAERVVDVVRIGSNGVSVGMWQTGRMEQTVMVRMEVSR